MAGAEAEKASPNKRQVILRQKLFTVLQVPGNWYGPEFR